MQRDCVQDVTESKPSENETIIRKLEKKTREIPFWLKVTFDGNFTPRSYFSKFICRSSFNFVVSNIDLIILCSDYVDLIIFKSLYLD